jgi:hypothetical protein
LLVDLLTGDLRQSALGWLVWLAVCATAIMSETPPPDPICSCGATTQHTADPHRCARGHALPGNQLHRVHGAYSFRDRGDASLPPDLRISADDMAGRVIADKGGIENCSTLLREYIQQTRNIRVVLDLLSRDMVENGLFTQKKRVRNVFLRWLETLDRFDRFATKVGLDREARQVPSLQDYLRQAQATGKEHQP